MGPVLDHLGSVLAFLLFVAAPVPLGLCAVAVRERETRRLSLPQALLLVLALWCVAQALVVHVLGVLHQLRFPGMLVAEILVFGVGVFGMARLAPRFEAYRWIEGSRRLANADAFETIVLLTLSFMGLTLLWWIAAMPVVNWDSWAFHMPHMVDWQQSGRFTRMAQAADRPRSSYPYGWEALCTLFLTPFGEDMLVTFPNLIAWALLGLASYQLARLFRARRIHALASAALLLAIHYIADPVNTMHVDLPFAALFTASAYHGAIAVRTGAGLPLGLSAATIGFACATRVTGPAYAVLLCAWLLFMRVRTDHPPLVPQPASRTAALLGCAVAVFLAAFWYAKNLLEVGRLLGGGTRLVTWSFVSSQALAFTFNPLRASSWKALIERSFHELDAPFVALVAMAALWPLAKAWSRHRGAASAAALALLLAGTGVVFAVTPLSSLGHLQMRLGLPFLALLAAAAAVGATRARLHAAVPAAFAVLSASRTFSGSRVLYPLMLLAVVWGVWRARKQPPRLSRARMVAGACALALAVISGTAAARPRRERGRVQFYGPFYAYLEQHVGTDEPVAYLISSRPYLFYGRRLARSVVYAPLGEGQAVEEWAGALRRRRIRIVAIGPWNDDSEGERAAVERLTAPNAPLVAVSGSGAPGEVTLFELEAEAAQEG